MLIDDIDPVFCGVGLFVPNPPLPGPDGPPVSEVFPEFIPRLPAGFNWGIPPANRPPIPGSRGVSPLPFSDLLVLGLLPPGGNLGPPLRLEEP